MSLKKIKNINNEYNWLEEDMDASPGWQADIEIRMDNYGYISIKDYGKISDMECTDVFPKNHTKRDKKISHLSEVTRYDDGGISHSDYKVSFVKQNLKLDVDKKLDEINKDFNLIKEHTNNSNTILDRELSTFLDKLNQAWNMINQFSTLKV